MQARRAASCVLRSAAGHRLVTAHAMATSFSPMTKRFRKEEVLEYHAGARPGKIEVVPTKPTATARDLSLAYTPGVAEPCLEIERDKDLSYAYTARGNLVAVVTN